MNLSDMKFPRQIEAEYGPDIICQTLMGHTVKLWSRGNLDVPVIVLQDPLKEALRAAMLQGRIRCGFEEVSEKLSSEKAGIANVRERSDAPHGDRVSRLILLSNDGAERFYRHAEQLLRLHAPRLLGCLLDTDSSVLGEIITGRNRQIKLVMAEHKDAVSMMLRAMLVDMAGKGAGQSAGRRPFREKK
jgi:hypothetical protein